MNKPDTMCLAPWTHTYLSPQTERRMCCASREPAQNFDQYIDTSRGTGRYIPITLEQHWNSDHMRSVRRRMMAGELLPECEVCNDKLLNTDVYRSYFNSMFGHKYTEAMAATDATGYTTLQPVSWDYRFSNLCNFKCRTCGDMLSSAWETEQRQHDMIDWTNPKNNWMRPEVKQAITQFQDSVIEQEFAQAVEQHRVEEVYWVGGEPLMYEQHWRYMKRIVELGDGHVLTWSASDNQWKNAPLPAQFSGSYNDLTDTPTLFSGSYTDLTNKPTLVTSYNDLSDKPTIPSNISDLHDTQFYNLQREDYLIYDTRTNKWTNRQLVIIGCSLLAVLLIRQEFRMDMIEEKLDDVIQVKERIKYTKNDLDCLTKNIYYEARGEPIDGQIAVGAVTLNRLKTRQFSNTICGVVHYKKNNHCAFSWTCEEEKPEINEHKTFAKIYKIAYTMYNDFKSGRKYDYTGGALYFHETSIMVQWEEEKQRILTIGSHTFYKEKKL